MDKLAQAQERVAEALDEIASLFKPGVKITLLVRRPHKPDQDFMMTNDDINEAIAMIERRRVQGN